MNGVEPLPHYALFGGKIAVADLPRYGQTALVTLVWLGLAPFGIRLCGRRGWWPTVRALERWWARSLLRALGIRLDIHGLEHVRPGERYVVVALHEGFADALALLHLPLNLRFVARDELFGWPLLGRYLRDTDHVEICPERGTWSYRQLRRAAPTLFASGDSLAIFPQGSILGIETAFSAGPFALARACRRPVLPVAITGGHRVWEHPYGPRLRYGQRMSLRVLPPLGVERIAAREVEDVRWEVQQALKAAALSGQMAPPRRYVPARDGYWDGYAFRIDPAFPSLAADVAHHRQVVANQAAAPGQPRASDT